MKKILSSDNPTYKYLEHLKLKKYRDESNEFLVFGEDIINEARRSANLKYCFCLEGYEEKYPEVELVLAKSLFFNLQGTQDHFLGALVTKNPAKPQNDKILILDEVQDPSNVGMLLRSALSFGFTTVVRSKGCSDFYNEKTIKASKGALFHLNLLQKDLEIYLEELFLQQYSILISEVSPHNSPLPKLKKIALVLGNEGRGIQPPLKKAHYLKIHLQTQDFDSLNVAVAGSILMWDLLK
ncbi:MAG: RNA methyltransferase [Acholeplasmatales bacterium]|jgi:TrmH family RNA methyltransferase|nr:RNA methyltransferase [Acholeplasmatales bacterium]